MLSQVEQDYHGSLGNTSEGNYELQIGKLHKLTITIYYSVQVTCVCKIGDSNLPQLILIYSTPALSCSRRSSWRFAYQERYACPFHSAGKIPRRIARVLCAPSVLEGKQGMFAGKMDKLIRTASEVGKKCHVLAKIFVELRNILDVSRLSYRN